MKNKFKILKYFVIFGIMVTGLTTLMIISAKIPKTSIKNNVVKSAKYLTKQSLFYEMIYNHNETKIDHYADSITLNITYNISSKNSFKSILSANYYGNNKKSEIDNLLKTSNDSSKYKAETQYIRYWHGTMVPLRVLLLFFNIKQIYILNIVLLIFLLTLLIYKLIKNKLYPVLIGFLLSLIITNSFVVPFCLEYSNMYFVSLIGSIIVLDLLKKKKDNRIFILFFILGIITSFVDFLTTETMTLLLPLIILLVYKYKDNKKINVKEILFLVIKIALIWSIGYVAMWVTKWIISALVLKVNIKDVALNNVLERLGKANVYEIGYSNLSKSVLFRNIFCLFPLCYLKNKLLVLILFLFILYTFIFFVRKSENNILSYILFLIALIPYIRYAIVYNHSYIHYFFTYRAQISSIFAISLGSYYMIDKNLLGGKKKCKKK